MQFLEVLSVKRVQLMATNPLTVTVSQLNRKIALMLKGEKSFSDLCVRGEISNFSHQIQSGHMYFCLKDEVSSIKAVMFRSDAEELDFLPENGMSVIVRGTVQCYEKEGINQIRAVDIIPDGAGSQAVALEQLKLKLEKEGLFSKKRVLPRFPEKICIITAEKGAALQDILNILGRRYPICSVILIPVTVQGETAPDSIAKAFISAGKTGADLIIFGRGGGSAEDLAAFNTEMVVRAVFESSIPTISAVGHETDVSLSDFAADLRAPTPSAAAELAVPDISELISTLNGSIEYLRRRTNEIIERFELSLKLIDSDIQSKAPFRAIENNEQNLNRVFRDINEKMNNLIIQKEYKLSEKATLISALNPLSVLMRGYSIVYKDDNVIFSEKEVNTGDKIRIKLSDGELNAVVE